MAQSPYMLSVSVNLTTADERVLIVNLRFMEEVDSPEKARRRVAWRALPKPGVLSCRRWVTLTPLFDLIVGWPAGPFHYAVSCHYTFNDNRTSVCCKTTALFAIAGKSTRTHLVARLLKWVLYRLTIFISTNKNHPFFFLDLYNACPIRPHSISIQSYYSSYILLRSRGTRAWIHTYMNEDAYYYPWLR